MELRDNYACNCSIYGVCVRLIQSTCIIYGFQFMADIKFKSKNHR